MQGPASKPVQLVRPKSGLHHLQWQPPCSRVLQHLRKWRLRLRWLSFGYQLWSVCPAHMPFWHSSSLLPCLEVPLRIASCEQQWLGCDGISPFDFVNFITRDWGCTVRLTSFDLCFYQATKETAWRQLEPEVHLEGWKLSSMTWLLLILYFCIVLLIKHDLLCEPTYGLNRSWNSPCFQNCWALV